MDNRVIVEGLRSLSQLGVEKRTMDQKIASTKASLLTSNKILTKSDASDDAKIATAVDTIRQLSSLVEELQSARQNGVKVAAALAGAVRRAQAGLIDIDDVFEEAAKHAEAGGSAELEALADDRLGKMMTD